MHSKHMPVPPPNTTSSVHRSLASLPTTPFVINHHHRLPASQQASGELVS